MAAQAAGSVQPEESWTARFLAHGCACVGSARDDNAQGGPWMNDRMQGAVAAATLALAVLSAVGLAATASPAEDHLALAAASATQALLP